jgi:DNA topoisomerase-1
MGAIFGSLDRDDDVLAIGLNRAVDLVAKKMASVRTIGAHPADKDLVSVRKGRFGPYVQHGKTVANLPRGVMMDDVTLDQAVALLAEKGKQLKPRGAAGRKGRGAKAARAGATAKADATGEDSRAASAMAGARPKGRTAKAGAATKAGKQSADAAGATAAAVTQRRKAETKRPTAKSKAKTAAAKQAVAPKSTAARSKAAAKMPGRRRAG